VAAALVDMLHDEIVQARTAQFKVLAVTTADDVEAVINGERLVAHFESRANRRKVSFESNTHTPLSNSRVTRE
jgi:hypothetical protein